MKARLIVNPSSGSESAPDALAEINRRLRERYGRMDIVMTTGAGDAADAAADAASGAYENLFIAGGDGTLNEALNGLHRVPGGFERLSIGIVPLGTGNDFASALGIPEDLDEALATLTTGRTVRSDLGLLNDRVFVNVSAGGFIAEVSEATNPELKTVARKLAYLIGGASVLLDYDEPRTRIEFRDPPAPAFDYKVELFAVANSRMIGGGRVIAPRAVFDDGALDVCIVEDLPMLEFLALLGAMSGGEHLEHPHVHYYRSRELEMTFERPIKVNTDGEVLETERCHYRVLPRAARFYCGEPKFAVGSLSR